MGFIKGKIKAKFFHKDKLRIFEFGFLRKSGSLEMEKRSYPTQPVVGVGAVVIRDGFVLLVKRENPPRAGSWSLPGGRVQEGELLPDALRREIREECGIEVEVSDLIEVYEYIEPDRRKKIKYHYIVFDFKARYMGGILAHSSDALDARWVHLDELRQYHLTKTVTDILRGGTQDP